MIEILKEGTKKKTTCKNCGAVLSYEMEDVCRCQNSPWDTGHGYIIDLSLIHISEPTRP